MPSYVSLNLNKDFLRLYHRGKSCAKPALVVYAMKNRTGLCRVGITTSKKIGNAVNLLHDKSAPIFVYCLSGQRSRKAVSALRKLGYTEVYNIGGIEQYQGQLQRGKR